MTKAVTRRPLMAEVRVRDRVRPYGIYGGQSGIGIGSSRSFFGFPLSVLFHHSSSSWG
jgi:hypothetical protein